MREYTTGFAGKDTVWETPKKRYVGVSGDWENVRGRWVGDGGAWVRYWPPQLRSNGYCRQTYTSTWNGSAWGAAVSSGAASCSATFPSGANVWVADAVIFPAGTAVLDGVNGTQALSVTVRVAGAVDGWAPGDYILVPLTGGQWWYRPDPTGDPNRYLQMSSQSWVSQRGFQARDGAGRIATVALSDRAMLAGDALVLNVDAGSPPATLGGTLALIGWTPPVGGVYTATGTFTNAIGIGDFDCEVGGAVCATVPALPNNLPNPDSETWAIAPAYTSTGLVSLWSQNRTTGAWSTRGNRIIGQLPFYHRGARRWFIVSSAGLWRGPNDIGATIDTAQPGWTQLSAASHEWQESQDVPQTSRRFVNLANSKLLLSRNDGNIVTIDASGVIESALPPPTLSGVYESTFFEANGVTFYSTGNYQNGFPAPTLAFSANPAGGSWTVVNMAQFPGWYYLIGITWHAASATFRLIISGTAGAPDGRKQYVYSSPDGVTWTEIVGARHGLTYATSITLVVGSSIVTSSEDGSSTRFAVSVDGGSTWTNTLLLTTPNRPTVLINDPLTAGDFWAPGTVTGGYGVVKYRLSGTTVTKVGEALFHASVNVTPDSMTAQSW